MWPVVFLGDLIVAGAAGPCNGASLYIRRVLTPLGLDMPWARPDAAPPQKTVAQSFLTLMTVQLSLVAWSSAVSAPEV
jgi:hypothetical protein